MQSKVAMNNGLMEGYFKMGKAIELNYFRRKHHFMRFPKKRGEEQNKYKIPFCTKPQRFRCLVQ